MSLTNFHIPNTPNNICIKPTSTTVANRYSIPWVITSEVITTAIAPVAPDIIPGLPPKIAVSKPTINAACNQTIGLTPATNENAIASGTSAKATVNPDNTSVFNCLLSENSSKKPFFFRYESNNIEKDYFYK
jgi:hypothetical protein